MAKFPDNAFTVHGEAVTLVTPHVVLSYPSLIKPRAFEGGDPKYQASLVFPKTFDLAVFKQAAFEALKAKFGANLPPNPKMGLRDGADKVEARDATGAPIYAKGYGPDKWFIGCSANADRPPQLLDAAVQEVHRTDVATLNKLFYGGAVVRAIIRAFGYDTKGNKGVSFGLNAVQFIKHGEPLGGGTINATGVFEAEGEGAEAMGIPVPAGGADAKAAIDALFG